MATCAARSASGEPSGVRLRHLPRRRGLGLADQLGDGAGVEGLTRRFDGGVGRFGLGRLLLLVLGLDLLQELGDRIRLGLFRRLLDDLRAGRRLGRRAALGSMRGLGRSTSASSGGGGGGGAATSARAAAAAFRRRAWRRGRRRVLAGSSICLRTGGGSGWRLGRRRWRARLDRLGAGFSTGVLAALPSRSPFMISLNCDCVTVSTGIDFGRVVEFRRRR